MQISTILRVFFTGDLFFVYNNSDYVYMQKESLEDAV